MPQLYMRHVHSCKRHGKLQVYAKTNSRCMLHTVTIRNTHYNSLILCQVPKAGEGTQDSKPGHRAVSLSHPRRCLIALGSEAVLVVLRLVQ